MKRGLDIKMKIPFKRPYIYWIFGIFVLYLILNILFSGFYDTIPLVIFYFKTVDWFKLGVSLILTLLIGFFVAVNSVLVYILYKRKKECKNGVAAAGAGGIGGLIVGVCPLCVTGLFPLVLGALGISFSFGTLPFQGIEIQILVLGVLIWGYWILKNKNLQKTYIV